MYIFCDGPIVLNWSLFPNWKQHIVGLALKSQGLNIDSNHFENHFENYFENHFEDHFEFE